MYIMMNLVTAYTKPDKWQPAGILLFRVVNSSLKVLGKENSKTRDRIETLVFVLYGLGMDEAAQDIRS